MTFDLLIPFTTKHISSIHSIKQASAQSTADSVMILSQELLYICNSLVKITLRRAGFEQEAKRKEFVIFNFLKTNNQQDMQWRSTTATTSLQGYKRTMIL